MVCNRCLSVLQGEPITEVVQKSELHRAIPHLLWGYKPVAKWEVKWLMDLMSPARPELFLL